MNSNGKSHVDQQRLYGFPNFEQPKPQPLVPAEQVPNAIDKKLAALEKQLELKLMGLNGAIAAMDRAKPLICGHRRSEFNYGDLGPGHFTARSRYRRGCDRNYYL